MLAGEYRLDAPAGSDRQGTCSGRRTGQPEVLIRANTCRIQGQKTREMPDEFHGKVMNELSANELKHTHREKALIELLKELKQI